MYFVYNVTGSSTLYMPFEWPDNNTSGKWNLSGCLWQEVVVYFILCNKQHPILQVPNAMYGAKYPCQLIATLPI